MATSNWAKVYFKDKFAGILEQSPGGDYIFTYDDGFQKGLISISAQLAITTKQHISKNALHPFFDNLIAEGTVAKIQAKAIRAKETERFKLLIAFGADLIGAVTIVDPSPDYEIKTDAKDYLQQLSLRSRASISGMQPKLLAIKKGNEFYAANYEEPSTHIAKLNRSYSLIIENEFLTMKATEILLPNDKVAQVEIAEIEDLGEALLVKRFDRNENGDKLHFEEFTQLLNLESDDKYSGSYLGMANYMNESRFCTKIDVEKLLRRVLACILFGNTDAHLKNFAMFHERDALTLTPIYDMVFTRYDKYKLADEMALDLYPNLKPKIQDIKPKHLKILTEGFGFKEKVLLNIKNDFEKRLDLIYEFTEKEKRVPKELRKKFKEHIEKRWNGLFKNIGQK